ncbi:von Willebrand factor type A domain protein [Teladorsagia circumcincta]|uniref:von Willebrand factor type A domain protein n=1 Tax=Teladorsagia circumcincta TaxID=45464 RepID=A0A2G9V3C7_TELCI|nr:von Willebrand factor type A domain protein [Teladorsagia circumcincta]
MIEMIGVKYGEGSLIVMSDGASSDCGTGPYQISEFQISANLRSLGFQTIYIPIGPIVSKQNIARVAGEQTQIVEIKDFAKADSGVIQRVVQKLEHPSSDEPPPPAVAPPPGATQGPNQNSNTDAPSKPGMTKGPDSQTYFGPDVSVITFTVPGSQQKLTTGRRPLQPSHKTPARPDAQTDFPPGVSVYTITLPPGSREKGTPGPGLSQPSGKVTRGQGTAIPPGGTVVTAPPGYDRPSPPRPGPSNEQETPGPGPSNEQVTPGPGPSQPSGIVTQGITIPPNGIVMTAPPGYDGPSPPGPGPSNEQVTPGPGPSNEQVTLGQGPSQPSGKITRGQGTAIPPGGTVVTAPPGPVGERNPAPDSRTDFPPGIAVHTITLPPGSQEKGTPETGSLQPGRKPTQGQEITFPAGEIVTTAPPVSKGELPKGPDSLTYLPPWLSTLVFTVPPGSQEKGTPGSGPLQPSGKVTPGGGITIPPRGIVMTAPPGFDGPPSPPGPEPSNEQVTQGPGPSTPNGPIIQGPGPLNPDGQRTKGPAPPPVTGPATLRGSLTQRNGESKAVVLILDGSSSVTESKWRKLKDYVDSVADSIQDAKLGVVSIGCPSKKSIPLREYTRRDFSRELGKLAYPGGKNDMYGALSIARDILEIDRSKWKAVLIFSNGQQGTRSCTKGDSREDEFTIIEKLREDGVATPFFTFEGNGRGYSSYIRNLAGSDDYVLDINIAGPRSEIARSLSEVERKLDNLNFPNMVPGGTTPPPPPTGINPATNPPPSARKPVAPPPRPRGPGPAGCGQMSLLERDGESKTVLFILDSSISVTASKWKKLQRVVYFRDEFLLAAVGLKVVLEVMVFE